LLRYEVDRTFATDDTTLENRMIGVLMADDHPAMRAGLVDALRREPGLVPLAAVADSAAALSAARRTPADVALVDDDLGEEDGILLGWGLKQLARAPRVLVYSHMVDPQLALAATAAGADGLVDKREPLEDLFAAIRTVGRGQPRFPPLTHEVVERSAAGLAPEDLPIFGMAMAGEPLEAIAAVTHDGERETARRIRRVLAQLRLRAAPAGT
jgi:DNA-binding NarL/FixJ family response regulator